MKMFTFLVEKAGGTYCSQHSGHNYKEAAERFADYALASAHLGSSTSNKTLLLSDLAKTVALDGLTNAFCTTHLDEKQQRLCVGFFY